jgi:hypothetical protein
MRPVSPALRRAFFLACIPAALVLCVSLGAQPLNAAQSSARQQNVQKQAAGKLPPAPAESRTHAPPPDVYAQDAYSEQ